MIHGRNPFWICGAIHSKNGGCGVSADYSDIYFTKFLSSILFPNANLSPKLNHMLWRQSTIAKGAPNSDKNIHLGKKKA